MLTDKNLQMENCKGRAIEIDSNQTGLDIIFERARIWNEENEK